MVILDILKMMLEEPEKLRKFGYQLIKALFNTLFASVLYMKTVGNYELIDFTNISQWYEFIFNGTVLLCIFFYLLSEVLLFHLLQIIVLMPLEWMANRNKNFPQGETRKFAIRIFKCTKLLEYDMERKRIKPSKHTQAFYEFLEFYIQKETQHEVHKIKNAFANTVVHTFFLFTIFFFFYFESVPSSYLLNTIVVVVMILLPLIYLSLCELIDFFDKESKPLLFAIKGLQFEKMIFDELQRNGVYLMKVPNPKDVRYEYLLRHNNKEYILHFHYNPKVVSEHTLNYSKDVCIKAEKKMIFITNGKLTSNAQEIVEEYKNSLKVIQFEDEKDLISQIENFINGKNIK